MADYFQMFSEIIPDLTSAERKWIGRVLEPPEHLASGLSALGINADAIDPDDWPGFEWEFIEADAQLWLHGAEHGNVSHVGEFVRAFLARFRPQESFALTWAETCSKPRFGDFGGGALFVTAKSVTVMNTTDWVEQQRRAFEQTAGPVPPL